MKKFTSALLALFLAVSIAACSAPASSPASSQEAQSSSSVAVSQGVQQAKPTQDRVGNEITVPENVTKIASLSPAFTVVLEDLGLLDKLVAMDTYSSFSLETPQEGVLELNMMQPDLEQLAALAPDIIFVSNLSSAGGADIFAPLREMGICVAEIPTADTVEAILEDVQFIADCTGETEKGEQLVETANETIQQVADKLKDVKEKPLVYFEISPAPNLYTTGSGTYLNQLIEMAGGENIFKDLNSWAAIGEEAVVTASPADIFTGVEDMPETVEEILSREAWVNVPAVENKQVYFIAPAISQQPTHRVVEGLLQMMEQIHPELAA